MLMELAVVRRATRMTDIPCHLTPLRPKIQPHAKELRAIAHRYVLGMFAHLNQWLQNHSHVLAGEPLLHWHRQTLMVMVIHYRQD